jgi:SAV_6107-like HEPN
MAPKAASAPATVDLLAAARRGLQEAAATVRPGERYATAHLAALRAAAAMLAARARPVDTTARGRPRSAWALLPQVAPELTEWAAFFAASAGKRAAAEAGLPSAVTVREGDDMLRDAETFLALVETTLGLVHQPALPLRSRAG